MQLAPLWASVCTALVAHGSRMSSAPPRQSARLAAADSVVLPTPKPSASSLTKAWWPVLLSHSLDRTRPHPVKLLGQSLVVWYDGDSWCCLRDACAHRFAPLSEGRVEPGGLHCAYHGWAFGKEGQCLQVPQAAHEAQSRACRACVDAFPSLEDAGMIWIWGDSSQTAEEEARAALPLPISPLLRKQLAARPRAGFMRDLPYGYELLGENLLDISHLPFSHHGVGTLSRAAAGPLSLRPLASPTRQAGEQEPSVPTPVFAAAVSPATADPIFTSLATYNPALYALPAHLPHIPSPPPNSTPLPSSLLTPSPGLVWPDLPSFSPLLPPTPLTGLSPLT